ncbi:MAG: DUF420 domain-containing protein [Cytophagales bacterium]|nr:DUF420 domain-containing protein [Cytophagales bacterium]
MKNDKLIYTIIGVLSVVVPLLVAVLLFMPQFFKLSDSDFSFLPHFHAILNSSTAICLIAGLIFVKKGNHTGHKTAMYSAFALSSIFLLSYVVYHSQTESVKYGGEGTIRIIYFIILISHIVLSAVVLPLILLSIYFAVTQRLDRHKKFVKFSYPIWLYVAITGVLVYAFLQPYY